MKSEWKFIDKDGLPKEENEYVVVTISDEYKEDGEKTGRGIAMVDTIEFTKDDGFVLEYDGYVYAWRELDIELPELPDGCVWYGVEDYEDEC